MSFPIREGYNQSQKNSIPNFLHVNHSISPNNTLIPKRHYSPIVSISRGHFQAKLGYASVWPELQD